MEECKGRSFFARPGGRERSDEKTKNVTDVLHFMVKVLNVTLFQGSIFCKNDTFLSDNMVYLLQRGL